MRLGKRSDHARMVVSQPTSPGEPLVAAYLCQRRLPFDFEPEIGGRRPDFSVDHPDGRFVCDVSEPTLRLPNRAGAFSSYPALRQVFTNQRKRKQGSGCGISRSSLRTRHRANE